MIYFRHGTSKKNSSRRKFLKSTAATRGTIGAIGISKKSLAQGLTSASQSNTFWPDGERLVISISTQFEAGGEPEFNMESTFAGNPLPKPYPDLPARTWFQYGYREGIPRSLDLWDEFNIKVTSDMAGDAVVRNPDLDQEIVKRAHEAAAHGMSWNDQFNMSRDEENASLPRGWKP